MATTASKGQWHPSYWTADKHGTAWNRAKEALKRDWSQTKADFDIATGKELGQEFGDTLKQATGSEAIPPPDRANADFDKMESAIAYGFAAHQELGKSFGVWDAKLEAALANEWDSTHAGPAFEDIKLYVRRGWDHRG